MKRVLHTIVSWLMASQPQQNAYPAYAKVPYDPLNANSARLPTNPVKGVLIMFLLVTLSSTLFSQEVTKKVTNSELKDEVINKLYSADGPYAKFKPENEIISKRDLHTKHFLNHDGTISAVIGAGNIHYIENGLYKTITSNLENSDDINYGFMNRHNSFKTYYGASSNEGINILFGKNLSVSTNKNLRMEYFSADYQKLKDPVMINNVSGVLKDESGVVYKNVLDGIDMEADQNSIGFKTSYVLNSLSSLSLSDDVAYLGFSEDISLPEDWKIKYDDKLGHAVLLFVDKTGELMMKMEPPLYFEKEGKSKISGSYTYIQSGRDVKITYYIQKEWLTNSNRKFPLVIDPTTVVLSQNTTSSWWTGELDEDSDCGASGGGDFRVGFDDGTFNDYYNAWSRFDVTSIPDNACISSATIEVYQTSFTNRRGDDNDLKFYVGNLSPLSTDPIPASCGTIYGAINAGGFYQRWDVWGTCSGTCTDYNETANAWKTLYSGTAANTDITNSLAQNFYVVGLDLTETHGDPIVVDNDEWLVFRGTNNANRPKLTVVYYQNNTAATGITVGSSTICNGGSTSLTVSGGSLVDGTWTWYAGGCGSGTAIGTGTSITVSPGSTTTYYVRAENSCRLTTCASTTITVRPLFTTGTIQSTGETICYGGDPGAIGNTTLSSGGDNSITYEWRANGTPIGSSNSSTYDPPAGLTTTTTYTRWAKDATCNTTFTQSTNSWVVTVRPVLDPSSAAANLASCQLNSTAPYADLTANAAPSGAQGTWTVTAAPGTVTSANANNTQVTGLSNTGATSTLSWSLSYTSGLACTIAKTGINITPLNLATTLNSVSLQNDGAATSTGTPAQTRYACRNCSVKNGNTYSYYDAVGKIIATIVDKTSNAADLGSTEVCIGYDYTPPTAPTIGDVKTITDNLGYTQPYLPRSWTIKPAAGSDATITLYFTTAELAALAAKANATDYQFSGLDLAVTKYPGGSGAGQFIAPKTTGGVFTPSTFGSYNSDYQVTFDVNSFSTFYVHPQTFPFAALPVELVSFTGSNIGNYNKLDWITASEINTNKFIVEKSIDGLNWNSIGEKTAAGNSSITLHYDLNDYNPVMGNNYYRLKMIDIDGTVSFSKIINIPLGVKEDNGFARVYPNPTSGNLNVEIQSTTNFETNVIAYDLVGKKIYDQKTSIEKGLNTLQIDFSNFASGVYVLQFSDVKGKIRTTKFVKE